MKYEEFIQNRFNRLMLYRTEKMYEDLDSCVHSFDIALSCKKEAMLEYQTLREQLANETEQQINSINNGVSDAVREVIEHEITGEFYNRIIHGLHGILKRHKLFNLGNFVFEFEPNRIIMEQPNELKGELPKQKPVQEQPRKWLQSEKNG